MACMKAMRTDSTGFFKSSQAEIFEDFHNLLGICSHPLVVQNKSIEQSTEADAVSESDVESIPELDDETKPPEESTSAHVCK